MGGGPWPQATAPPFDHFPAFFLFPNLLAASGRVHCQPQAGYLEKTALTDEGGRVLQDFMKIFSFYFQQVYIVFKFINFVKHGVCDHSCRVSLVAPEGSAVIENDIYLEFFHD